MTNETAERMMKGDRELSKSGGTDDRETCVCVNNGTSEKSSLRINYPIKIKSQRVTLKRSRYN